MRAAEQYFCYDGFGHDPRSGQCGLRQVPAHAGKRGSGRF
jgi:hypothetical protein